MLFNNDKQLENYLLMKSKSAVSGVERKIHDTIDKCLRQYYAQFEPNEYIRTEQLLHSLVKTDVKKVGNGFVAEVYFDESAMNYETGSIEIKSTATKDMWGYATWGAEQVLDTSMHGTHGGYIPGVPIWDKSMAIIGDVYALIKQELIAQGVPIK